MLTLCPLRCFSTPRVALNIWVKHKGGPSVKVPIQGCNDIDDFAQKVKRKIDANCQVALFTSLDKEALDPGLKIKELLKTDALKQNSGESPLCVKLIPVIHDSIASKTIYIRDTDDDGQFSGEYLEVQVRNDEDVSHIIKHDDGLMDLSCSENIIINFDQIEDGKKYQFYNDWQAEEKDAMDEEIALAMKNYLHLQLGSNVIEMPTQVEGADGKVVQEWHAAFKVGDVLYLCEAKHVMCIDKLTKIPQRIKTFKEQFQAHAQEEFSTDIKKVVGVACGTHFPLSVCEEAHKLGLICVYLVGWHNPPYGFKIEF